MNVRSGDETESDRKKGKTVNQAASYALASTPERDLIRSNANELSKNVENVLITCTHINLYKLSFKENGNSQSHFLNPKKHQRF